MPAYKLQFAQPRKDRDDPKKIVLEPRTHYFHAASYEEAEYVAEQYLAQRRIFCGATWHSPVRQCLHERSLPRHPMKFFPDFDQHLPAYLS